MSFWFARTKKKSTGRFHEQNQIPEKTLRGNVFSIGRRQSLGLGHIQAENLGPASDAGLGCQNASFSPLRSSGEAIGAETLAAAGHNSRSIPDRGGLAGDG